MNKIKLFFTAIILLAMIATIATLWFGTMVFAIAASVLIIAMFITVWAADLLC